MDSGNENGITAVYSFPDSDFLFPLLVPCSQFVCPGSLISSALFEAMSIFHLENEDTLDAYGTSVLHVSYFFPKSLLLFFFRRLFYVIT